MKALMCSNKISTNLGLLLLRLTLGLNMAIWHGYGKLINSAGWEGLGNMAPFTKYLPIPAVALGFMAMFSEFFCSILISVGLFTRLASGLLFFTMAVAVNHHYIIGKGGEQALVYAGMALALIFTGSGDYSLSKKI